MSPGSYRIRSLWEGRSEGPPQIAARFRAFLALSTSPPGRRWFAIEKPDGYCDLAAHPDRIEGFVADGIHHFEDGRDMPQGGYLQLYSAMCADQEPRSDDPYIVFNAGCEWQNDFGIFSDNRGITDPRYVAYAPMKTNVLAIARAFEPDWCEAGPFGQNSDFDIEPYNRPPITPAWMAWLSPRYAVHLTDLPEAAIVERYPDGSLFVAATQDTFVTADPAHLAMAQAIHARVNPLNFTIPFNGRCGPNPHRRPPVLE